MKVPRLSVLEKKFPTVIGLTILLGALVAGIFFIGSGPGVFSPRATPETTPSQVKITNITDSSFTVSFLTTDITAGFLKYGTSANALKSQASDDRDQLTGNVGTYTTHHITVRGLQPNTSYFFTLGTGSTSSFDNNGQPYTIKTGAKVSGSSLAQTIYGTVLTNASTPAEGSMVYITIENSQELSALVRSSGTWAIPLAQLRSTDGKSIPQISSSTPMSVFVQGKKNTETAQLATTVGQPQLPVETITLGQAPSPTTTTSAAPISSTSPTQSPSAGTTAQPTFTASGSAQVSPSPSPTIKATATPVASASATPVATATAIPKLTPTPSSASVSMPATDSAKPISGNAEYTLFFFVLGLSLTAVGGMIYLALKPQEVINK